MSKADSYVGDCDKCTGNLITGYTASGVKLARHVFRLYKEQVNLVAFCQIVKGSRQLWMWLSYKGQT